MDSKTICKKTPGFPLLLTPERLRSRDAWIGAARPLLILSVRSPKE